MGRIGKHQVMFAGNTIFKGRRHGKKQIADTQAKQNKLKTTQVYKSCMNYSDKCLQISDLQLCPYHLKLIWHMLEITQATNMHRTALGQKKYITCFLTKYQPSITNVRKNINKNINRTKIEAIRAQQSTRFIPEKIKEIGKLKVTAHNQSVCQCNHRDRACAQKRKYVITGNPILAWQF